MFRLQIKTDNAAFCSLDYDDDAARNATSDRLEEQYEVARILEATAKRIRENGEFEQILIDANGNRVGSCEVIE